MKKKEIKNNSLLLYMYLLLQYTFSANLEKIRIKALVLFDSGASICNSITAISRSIVTKANEVDMLDCSLGHTLEVIWIYYRITDNP